MNETELYRRCQLFAEMLGNACGLGVWAFGPDKKLYISTCAHEREFQLFLRAGNCLDRALTEADTCQTTLMMDDPLGMFWLADFMRLENGKLQAVIMVGPMFDAVSSLDTIRNALQGMNLSVALGGLLIEQLQDVPVLSLNNIHQYAIMLHWCLTGRTMAAGDIRMLLHGGTALPNPRLAEGVEAAWDPERSRLLEERILQCVREGNLSADPFGSSVSTHGEPDAYNLGDPVRENKDTVIIFTALCARAAIEGGLSPRTAKALEVTYVRAAEQCARTSDLINLNTKMVQDFIRRVHASRAQPAMTLPVQECMEYVQTHLTEPFTLADLARHVGYTEYYLTKKFQKETGTKLADYIRGARLEQARLQLETTQRSVRAISEEFQFGTPNYFSTAFARRYGQSPAQYRASLGMGGTPKTKATHREKD